MSSRFSTRILLLGLVVVSLIGVLDAVIGEVWDHLALFAFAAVLAIALLLRTNPRRRAVSVRGDLARWLTSRAQLTGEDVDRVTDRAIATYRSALEVDSSGARDDGSRAPRAG